MRFRIRWSSVTRSILVLVAMFVAAPSWAQTEGDLATKWKVNDADPKSSIPSVADRNKDPLEFAYFLQDLAARAERATKESRWPDVVKYYEALGFAVPEASISFSRLCQAYAKLGKYEIAAGNCGKAVSLPMAKVIDHLRFIDYTLKGERFGQRDIENVEASLKHLRQHIAAHPQPDPSKASSAKPATDPAAAEKAAAEPAQEPRKRTREELIAAILERQKRKLYEALNGQPETPQNQGPPMHLPTEVEMLNCKFSVRLRDSARLATCIDELGKLKVDDRQIFALSWAQAMIAKDESRADGLLERARGLGLPEATLASMKTEHEKTFPPGLLAKGRWPLALLGLVLAAGLALVLVRSRRRGSTHAAA